MKIIKHGKTKRFVCSCCECVFDAGKNEYETTVFDNGETYFKAECPDCKLLVYVDICEEGYDK